jgi:hypothetical protein
LEEEDSVGNDYSLYVGATKSEKDKNEMNL